MEDAIQNMLIASLQFSLAVLIIFIVNDLAVYIPSKVVLLAVFTSYIPNEMNSDFIGSLSVVFFKQSGIINIKTLLFKCLENGFSDQFF